MLGLRQNELVTPNTIFSVACPLIGHNGILNELCFVYLVVQVVINLEKLQPLVSKYVWPHLISLLKSTLDHMPNVLINFSVNSSVNFCL